MCEGESLHRLYVYAGVLASKQKLPPDGFSRDVIHRGVQCAGTARGLVYFYAMELEGARSYVPALPAHPRLSPAFPEAVTDFLPLVFE